MDSVDTYVSLMKDIFDFPIISSFLKSFPILLDSLNGGESLTSTRCFSNASLLHWGWSQYCASARAALRLVPILCFRACCTEAGPNILTWSRAWFTDQPNLTLFLHAWFAVKPNFHCYYVRDSLLNLTYHYSYVRASLLSLTQHCSYMRDSLLILAQHCS